MRVHGEKPEQYFVYTNVFYSFQLNYKKYIFMYFNIYMFNIYRFIFQNH